MIIRQQYPNRTHNDVVPLYSTGSASSSCSLLSSAPVPDCPLPQIAECLRELLFQHPFAYDIDLATKLFGSLTHRGQPV